MQSVVPKDGDTFEGESGAVMNGSRLLTSFIREGSYYVFTGQTQQSTFHGECDADYPRCGYSEDLFMDGKLLRHVGRLADVGVGKWFFDYTNDKIYMGDDPTGHTVETSITSQAFSGSAKNVTIKNLTIEKYATRNQLGTVDSSAGSAWIVMSNTIRYNHGAGLVGGTLSQILSNRLNYNGQHGIGGTGDDLLVANNEIAYNNTTGVSTAWSAGGSKFALSNRLIVRNNCVHDNWGPGLWTDIDNRSTLYEGNIVYKNSEVGIYHEISYSAIIRNNTVADNGFDNPGWVFGAQIMMSTSSGAEVYGNRVQTAAAYGHAITVAAQTRAEWTALDNNIHHNDITFLGSGGQVAAATDIANYGPTLYSRTKLDYNTYHVTSLNDGHWGWDNALQNWASLRSYSGIETHGQIDTKVVPITPNCSNVLP